MIGRRGKFLLTFRPAWPKRVESDEHDRNQVDVAGDRPAADRALSSMEFGRGRPGRRARGAAMRITRTFTAEGASPYDGIEFRTACSEIRNPDG